nr:immunoglobulin heavy chain junction region [Macaca mulatta]
CTRGAVVSAWRSSSPYYFDYW